MTLLPGEEPPEFLADHVPAATLPAAGNTPGVPQAVAPRLARNKVSCSTTKL
jgi:hypothetical protein